MDLLKILPILISLLGVAISLGTLFISNRTNQSKELLQEAILLLERAYDSLTENGKTTSPVNADRLNWLTSARHIEDYKKIKSSLKTKTHNLICNAQEEHWRHKFYILFKDHRKYPVTYFEGNIKESKLEIEPISALVIFSFSHWPKDKNDPLEAFDYATIIKSDPTFLKANIFFKQYIEKMNKFKIHLS